MRPAPPRGCLLALAGTAVVLAFVLFGAHPAAAHAVLLRTVPSPQTTAPAPPDAVRLHFSEPVEVAFGAVRVFDVDGERVDEARIETADGRRELVVPAELRSGTYTVTWRVLSTDGHRISGGFQFYVGAPSTISAVAVEGDAGAGRAVTLGYGAVRFTWYGALLAVVGLVVVRRFVWTPAVRAAGMAGSEATIRFRRRFNRLLPWAWGALLAAWGLRLVFQTASISGLGLVESARPGVLGDMIGTGFGRSWVAGLGFTLVAGPAVAGLTRRAGLFGAGPQTWLSILAACVVGLALAAANSGHAGTEGNPALGVPSAAVHLLAVATWVGGLGALVGLGASAWSAVPVAGRDALLRQVLTRYSRMALVSVAVLVASGSVNSFLDLASVSDLWSTTYGRVLSAKILLLGVALAFGGWHLWVLPRRLATGGGPENGGPENGGPENGGPWIGGPWIGGAGIGGATRSFRRSSTLELVVLAAVVGFASALVALVPGRSLAQLARGPVNQEERAGQYTVQLFLDPSTPGANEIHLTFIDPNGLGAAEVTALTTTLAGDDGTPQPLSMRLLSPGHFVANGDLAAGAYRLALETRAPSPALSVSFGFKLRATSGGGG